MTIPINIGDPVEDAQQDLVTEMAAGQRQRDALDEGVDQALEDLERAFHPEGRCVICGAGKPYWRHRQGAEDWHQFKPTAT